MREALSYLVQALTLNYQNSSFTKGGLLAWTDPKPDALQNTMSDILLSYKSAVCECLTKHAKPNTTCAAAAASVDDIAACHPKTKPLVSMGDLLHNSSAGYRCRPSLMPAPHTRLRCFSRTLLSRPAPCGGRRPEKPTAVDAGFYQWGGVPNFGTLGIVPKQGNPRVEKSQLSKLGCTPRTNETTTADLWGGDWKCQHLHMASVDLSNYMPVAQVKSLRRFFWGSSASGESFELRAYYFVEPPCCDDSPREPGCPSPACCDDSPREPGCVGCPSPGATCCPCAGSSLIGVTTDIERLLLDNIEPFVGSSCADIRTRVDGMAVNYFNWQECCRGFKTSIIGGRGSPHGLMMNGCH